MESPNSTIDPIAEERFAEEHDGGPVKLGWTPQVWRTIITMGIAYFAFKFIRYAFDSWTPMMIQENFGGSTEAAGHSSTWQDWGGFLGVLFAILIMNTYIPAVAMSLVNFVYGSL